LIGCKFCGAARVPGYPKETSVIGDKRNVEALYECDSILHLTQEGCYWRYWVEKKCHGVFDGRVNFKNIDWRRLAA
jgi:hypothetical protein